MFADDAKMFKHIRQASDSKTLNKCCQELHDWSETWLMKLNVDKCKVLSIGRGKNLTDYKYDFETSQSGKVELGRVNSILASLWILNFRLGNTFLIR